MGKNFCCVVNKWCKYNKHGRKFCHNGTCTFCNTEIKDLTSCPRVESIKTITLYELIMSSNFDDVFSTICKYFPDEKINIDGYRDVYNKLKCFHVEDNKYLHLDTLFIDVQKFEEDGKECLSTYGKHVVGNNPMEYSIEFLPWKDWVSMYVTQETIDNLSSLEIIAGCLFEMTYHGFSEVSVSGMLGKLLDAAEEMKSKK